MSKVDIWLIVGTRRWARIMVAELCAVLPEGSVIRMVGNPDDYELRQWLGRSAFCMRIEINKIISPVPPTMIGVAFIVNSAYLHHSSIEEALTAGYHVVSEKPISFSKEETCALIRLANTLRLELFCTNTYLFADYLVNFRKNWLDGRQYTDVHISWTDASSENRYDVVKTYDSSVPIIFDVLPHIANILLSTIGKCCPLPVKIDVTNGGSEVFIQYCHENVNIFAHIARNARQRTRCINFLMPNSAVCIDFSKEPGIIIADGLSPVCAGPDWKNTRKPIAAMLVSVIDFFEFGKVDGRISPLAGLFGNELIDGVVGSYVDQQVDLLSSFDGKQGSFLDSGIRYAQKEFCSVNERVLPHIASNSPLRRLSLSTQSIENLT